MRRNQHGAHSLGVEVVVGRVRSVGAGANDASNGGSVNAVTETRGARRQKRISQPLKKQEVPPEESTSAWIARIKCEVECALRVVDTPGVPLAFRRAQALARVIHVLCMEIGYLMGILRPASDLPVALPMRVRNVLTLVFLGAKPPEIARRLGLSHNSVTTYLRDAANHLDVSGTDNAVKEAFARKLLLTEDLETLLALPTVAPLPANRLSQEELL